MKRILLNLFPLLFHIGVCNSQLFIADQNCIFKELGASSKFEITPHVDFYIPHNWINNNDKRNYLHVKLFSRDLVLRHPLNRNKVPNEIDLPLEYMKIGWNRIYLKKDGNKLNVIVRPVEDNSIKIIQSFTIQRAINFPGQEESLFVTGLHSLVDCHRDLNTRYYKIPAGKSIKIPYVLFKQVDRFDAYSETNPFNFEISFSGKRRQICKEEIRNQPDVYSVPKDCRHWPVNKFAKDTVYNIYMYPAAYDSKDILRYKDFTFTEFELHNTGNTDFYIRTFIKPESQAPITFLKEYNVPTPSVVESGPEIVVPVPSGDKGCGISTKMTMTIRILGGETAKPSDWPWMVAFVRNSDGLGISEQHECGGVLITERHVLTSARCFDNVNTDDMKARLGEYNFNTHDERNHSDFRIAEVRTHESFTSELNDHDIAIIKLEGSPGERFTPVCLTPPDIDWEDHWGYITGWGQIDFGGNNSNHLREAFVQIWKRSDCIATYAPHNGDVTNNMMCAGSRGTGVSCEGDAGGPLVVQILPEPQWYVVGIDSWGTECGLGLPTVYTKVDKYLDWIKNNTIN